MCIWTTVLDKDPKVNIVEKGQPFKQMVLQQLDITLKKKKKLGCIPQSIYKNEHKMNHRSQCKT